MKKIIKLSMIVMVAGLVVGCATNSDIENLQSQIDGLKTSVAQASSDAQSAQSSASEASAHATAAEIASKQALSAINGINAKLDNLFHKAMIK